MPVYIYMGNASCRSPNELAQELEETWKAFFSVARLRPKWFDEGKKSANIQATSKTKKIEKTYEKK